MDSFLGIAVCLLLVGLVSIMFSARDTVRRERLHQHSDIADKIACATCRNTAEFEDRDWQSFYGSMVELVFKHYNDADARAELLKQLPALIDRHTYKDARGYSVDGAPRKHMEIRAFSGIEYVALSNGNGALSWVELEFARVNGLVTQFTIDEYRRRAASLDAHESGLCPDCGAKLNVVLEAGTIISDRGINSTIYDRCWVCLSNTRPIVKSRSGVTWI